MQVGGEMMKITCADKLFNGHQPKKFPGAGMNVREKTAGQTDLPDGQSMSLTVLYRTSERVSAAGSIA